MTCEMPTCPSGTPPTRVRPNDHNREWVSKKCKSHFCLTRGNPSGGVLWLVSRGVAIMEQLWSRSLGYGLPSDGTAPYALMVFAGLLPWSFFATAVVDASNSLIGNANLISKVYFPR